jgi:cell division septal protein FtsQ
MALIGTTFALNIFAKKKRKEVYRMKKNLFIQAITILGFGIVILWLVKELLFPSNYLNLNISGTYGGEHMYGTYGFGVGTFSLLLVFLIKALIVLFVIALIVGLFMAVKNYIFTPQNISAFNGSTNRVEHPKKACNVCGKTLEDDWKACPYCAAEVK